MATRREGAGVLRRLAASQSGNVMMITAASLIPLIGMGGAGFDIGRVYLVKNRLQQACDASVLAYRRTMSGTNVTSDTEPTARNFFNTNFNPGRYGAGTPTISYSVDSQVVVHGVANVIVPMALMQVLGFKQVALNVTCDAQLQLPNTDVMFVLDTTGSMTDTNPGDSTSKISALQTAVVNFYNTLEAAKVAGTQVRYGFVPYSNTVNVGMLLNRNWVTDSASYQSRLFDHQITQQTGTTSTTTHTASAWTPDTYTTTTSAGDPENCVAPASTISYSAQTSTAWSPSATSLPRSRTNYRTVDGSSYSASTQSDGTCKITKKTYNNVQQSQTETYDNNTNGGNPTYTTYNYWQYKQIAYDVSGLKGAAGNGLMAGGFFYANTGTPATNSTNPPTTGAQVKIAWNSTNACIEERKTLRQGESGTAYDEDVDLTPTPSNPDTQWRPFLPQLLYARNVTGYSGTPSTWPWSYPTSLSASNYVNLSSYPYDRAACPSPARKLMSKEQGLTASVLQSYVNGLKTGGDTYHDIGFLWGVRLASAQGLFASENAAAPNGFDIARNIIFMTDGDTDTHIQDYDAYGLSALDRRRTSTATLPDDGTQNGIVEDRLSHYCDVAKSKGMTVWVIAFGTSLTSMLQNCATSGRAYQANNSSELDNAFADIASRIAQLRLTK